MVLVLAIIAVLFPAVCSPALAEYKGVLTFHTGNADGILTKKEADAQIAAAGIVWEDTFSVDFDLSVKGISDNALRSHLGITSVYIPDNVISVAYPVFDPWCALEEFIVSPNNKYFTSVDGILFSKDKTALIKYPSRKHGYAVWFDYVVPDGVISICDYAFADCWTLRSIVFPESLESIGDYAFVSCLNLKSFFFPRNVNHIGYMAFSANNSSAISVSPDNSSFSSLDGVLFDKSITTLLRYPPAEESRTHYIIPDSVTKIETDAFSGAENLISVDMPDSLVDIGDSAFSSCYVLTNVVVGNNVTKIGAEAFSDCNRLTSIVIGERVRSIGDDAFIKRVTGPSDLTIYSTNDAYAHTYALNKAIRWKSLSEWPPAAKTIVFSTSEKDGTLTQVEVSAQLAANDATRGSTFFAEFNKNVLAIGDSAFSMCTGLAGVVIPDSVTAICDEAFRCCMSLKTVIVGNNVSSIGGLAFYKCKNLTAVFIPKAVKSIDNIAFYGCTRLSEIHFNGNAPEIASEVFDKTATEAVAHVNDEAEGFPADGWLWNGLVVKYQGFNPFADVTEGAWYYDDVMFVNRNNLMSGTPGAAFSPDLALTRAMIVTILWRNENCPDEEGMHVEFTDVEQSSWYAKAVGWAAVNEIVQGYGEGLFGPNDPITRQDLAVILARYMGFIGSELSVTGQWIEFSDEAEISSYAMNAIQTLWKLDIIRGFITNRDGQDLIAPKSNATRAQAAAILHRFINKTRDSSM